jgi:hypothetical protein
MHRGKVEAVPAAKPGEVYDRQRVALGVAKSVPGQRRLLSVRAGQGTDVVPDARMSAVGPVDPLLFGAQQLSLLDILQDLEREARFAMQNPGTLQMSVVMVAFA